MCRHDEQATHVADIIQQFSSTQQALQGLQAEFADLQCSKTSLTSQLQESEAEQTELQGLHAAQGEEMASLQKQLSQGQSLVQDLQVRRDSLNVSIVHDMAA